VIGRQVRTGEVIAAGERCCWYAPSRIEYGTVVSSSVDSVVVDWDDDRSRSMVPTWSARLRVWPTDS
jgi:hypothetical protein